MTGSLPHATARTGLVWLALGAGTAFASGCSDESPSLEAAAGAAATAGRDVAHSGSTGQGVAGSGGIASGVAGHGGASTASAGSGGGVGAGGTGSTGGTGSAGDSGSGIAGAAGGSTVTPMSCGAGPSNRHPFGCNFAWGRSTPSGSLANYGYLQLVSTWVGSEVKADGSISSCNACSWLTSSVAPTQLVPVFYAYFIGFYGHANGLVDGNQSGDRKLTIEGAALIKANRAKVVAMHAWYAQQVHNVWPTRPLVWLLDGDYIQYSDANQGSPLTMGELGQLAADITCAIKSNMPNAVVAINHSFWNTDELTISFWNEMNRADYDLVWASGVANNDGFINGATTSEAYNSKTATYAFLHQITGRPIWVDTSAGASAAGDSWSTASAAQLNARIADGVIAAAITGGGTNGLQSRIDALGMLNPIPACP